MPVTVEVGANQSHVDGRESNDIAGAPKSMVKQFARRLHDILMQFAWARGSGGSARESIQPISPGSVLSPLSSVGRDQLRANIAGPLCPSRGEPNHREVSRNLCRNGRALNELSPSARVAFPVNGNGR